MSTPSSRHLPKLIALPPGTSVEFTLWALLYYGIEHEPRYVAPFFHLIFAKWYGTPEAIQPIYIDGALVIGKQRHIADFFDTRAPSEKKLYPETKAEMAQLDHLWKRSLDMGYATANWAYYEMLPNKKVMYPMMTKGTPWVQRAVIWLLYPLVWRLMWKTLKVSEEVAQKDLITTDEVFEEMDELLEDGRPYLMGERFTLADLTFCTFASPVIWPDEFGGPDHQPRPLLKDLPLTTRGTIEEYRKSRVGEYVLRVYREDRFEDRRGVHPRESSHDAQ